MKKLFISLCIILFTISCTNEEETNNYTPVDNQSNSTSEIILQERNSSLPREHPSPMLQTSLDALMQ